MSWSVGWWRERPGQIASWRQWRARPTAFTCMDSITAWLKATPFRAGNGRPRSSSSQHPSASHSADDLGMRERRRRNSDPPRPRASIGRPRTSLEMPRSEIDTIPRHIYEAGFQFTDTTHVAVPMRSAPSSPTGEATSVDRLKGMNPALLAATFSDVCTTRNISYGNLGCAAKLAKSVLRYLRSRTVTQPCIKRLQLPGQSFKVHACHCDPPPSLDLVKIARYVGETGICAASQGVVHDNMIWTV